MPFRAKPYCSTPGCGNRVTAGRCGECRTRAERWRGSRSERGYDSHWFATRGAFLADHPLCEVCEDVATEVDHIDGLGPLGPRGHDRANLRPFCKRHHSQRTARDQPGGWWAELRHGQR